MNEKKSTNRITLINIMSTVLLQGIAFFTAPLFSRLLGVENYGIYLIFSTWVSIVAVVFSLETLSTISIAPGVFPEEKQIKYQSSVLYLSIVAYFIFSAIVLIFIKPISLVLRLELVLCVLILIKGFSAMCMNFANAKFTIEFKAESNLILSLFISLTGIVISLLLFVVFPKTINYYARILGVTIVEFCVSIIFCFFIFKNGQVFYNKEYWKFCVPLSTPHIFHAVSGLLLNQSDKVMMQQMLDNSEVGIYGLAYSFSAVLTVIYCSLNNSWAPFYFYYSRNKQIKEVKEHAIYYIELFTILSIGFLLLSPEVFYLFASTEYWGGYLYIPLFTVSAYFTFLYSFPVNYETFHQNSKIIGIMTTIASVVNIILNYFFIKKIGAMGAAYATVIAHMIQFLAHYFCAEYLIVHDEYPFKLKIFWPYISGFFTVFILCIITEGRFAILRWGIGMLLGLYELRQIVKRKIIF